MLTKKTWKEFRDSGFLWWINMILHTFGWAIVVDVDDDGEKNNTEGYIKVSQYMKDNVSDLLKEAEN